MARQLSSSATSRSYVVIPARYASTRLPRKMLLRETGKTLLQHTYEAAAAAKRPAGVLVATLRVLLPDPDAGCPRSERQGLSHDGRLLVELLELVHASNRVPVEGRSDRLLRMPVISRAGSTE